MVKSLWQEFKSFAFKGNMLDLAIAVVIGAAFGAVVNSLVKDIVMPVVSYISPGEGGGYQNWHLGRIMIGKFLSELVNFLVVATAVFLLVVKIVGTLMKKMAAAPASSEPVVKECPFCLSNIPIKAVKCAHCTSDLTSTTPPARG